MNLARDHRVVVLGGGYAGLTTAARIGENAGDVALTLIDAKTEFVERIRLHEIAGGSSPLHLPYHDFMASRGGNFVHAKIISLEPARTTPSFMLSAVIQTFRRFPAQTGTPPALTRRQAPRRSASSSQRLPGQAAPF